MLSRNCIKRNVDLTQSSTIKKVVHVNDTICSPSRSHSWLIGGQFSWQAAPVILLLWVSHGVLKLVFDEDLMRVQLNFIHST